MEYLDQKHAEESGGQVMLSLTLDQRLQLHCPVCKMSIDEEQQADTAFAAAMFGYVDYAVCPSCIQQVDEKTRKSKSYRKRADKYIKERRMKIMKTNGPVIMKALIRFNPTSKMWLASDKESGERNYGYVGEGETPAEAFGKLTYSAGMAKKVVIEITVRERFHPEMTKLIEQFDEQLEKADKY
jgi:hypothetical protein